MALEHWLPHELKDIKKVQKAPRLPETEKTKEIKRLIKSLETKIQKKKDLVRQLKESFAIEEQKENQ